MKTHQSFSSSLNNPYNKSSNIVTIHNDIEFDYDIKSPNGNCRWSVSEITEFIDILREPENSKEYVMNILLVAMKTIYNKRLIDLWIFYQFLLCKNFLLEKTSEMICEEWDSFRKNKRTFDLLQERIENSMNCTNFVGEQRRVIKTNQFKSNSLMKEEMNIQKKYNDIIELCSKDEQTDEDIEKILNEIPEIYNDSFISYQQQNLLFGWYNYFICTKIDVDEN